MSIVTCPQCSTPYSIEGLGDIQQILCQKCNIPVSVGGQGAALPFGMAPPPPPSAPGALPPPPPPPSAPAGGLGQPKTIKPPEPDDDLDLDLKEWVSCPNCGEDYYPEQIEENTDDEGKVKCRRCRRSFTPGEEPGPRRGKAAKSNRPGSSSGKKRGRVGKPLGRSSGKSPRAKTAAKSGPRKLVIDEELKTRVFNALKSGRAKEALEILVDFTDGRIDDAKKVFAYLQSDAKKRGILGAPAPAPQAKTPVAAPVPAPPPPMAAPVPAAPVPAVPAAEAEPAESGFLQRVAIAGRLAQLELLCDHRKFNRARELGRILTENDPNNARAHAAYGEALLGLGQEQAAFQAFSRALQINNQNVAAVRGYARALTRKGEFRGAIEAYCRITGIGFGEIQDAVALAELCKRVGENETAQKIMTDVLSRAPHSVEPQRELAIQALESGDIAGAARTLRTMLEEEEPPYASSVAVAERLREAAQHPEAACAAARAFRRANRSVDALRLLVPWSGRNDVPEIQGELGRIYLREGNEQLAMAHLEASHNARPGEPEIARILGELFLKRDDAARAVAILSAAAQAQPQEPALLLLCAESYKKMGNASRATELLNQARRLSADDNELKEQIEALRRKTLDERIRAVRRRLSEAPEDAAAHLELGIVLLEKGEADEAFSCLLPACRDPYLVARVIELAHRMQDQLNKNKRQNVLLLRALYVRTQNIPKAIEVVEAFLAENEDDEELRLVLIDLYLMGQRRSAAVAAFLALIEDVSKELLVEVLKLGAKILQVEPERAEVWLAVARGRVRLSAIEASFMAFDEYLSREPEDLDTRRELAELAMDHGQTERALGAMRAVYESGQASKDDYILMARACLKSAQEPNAVHFLQKALEKDPENPELQLRLTEAERALNERQLQGLSQELQGGQGSQEQRRRLAELLVETERRDQAIQVLQSMGSEGEPDVIYHRFAAEHYARRGKYRKAEENLRVIGRVLKYSDGSENEKALLYRIGAMYEQGGDWRGARRSYLELFSQDMNYRDVADRLTRLVGAPQEREDGESEEAGADLAEVIEKRSIGGLGSIFESLSRVDVTLDPNLLASVRAETARREEQTQVAVSSPLAPVPGDPDAMLNTSALPDLSQLTELGPLPELGPIGSFETTAVAPIPAPGLPPAAAAPLQVPGPGAPMPPQGMPPQGMPNMPLPPAGAFPPGGAPAFGAMQPGGAPPGAFPPGQPGMPPQGMPPQGTPNMPMPPQGMPPQGMHPPLGMPPSSGHHPTAPSGQFAAPSSGHHPAVPSGQHPAPASGQYPAAPSGQHPAPGNPLMQPSPQPGANPRPPKVLQPEEFNFDQIDDDPFADGNA